VLGLLAFAWLVLGRFLALRTAGRREPESPTSWVVAGASGAMADLLVHGFIDNSYFLVDLAFLFWLTLALIWLEPDIRILVARILAT